MHIKLSANCRRAATVIACAFFVCIVLVIVGSSVIIATKLVRKCNDWKDKEVIRELTNNIPTNSIPLILIVTNTDQPQNVIIEANPQNDGTNWYPLLSLPATGGIGTAGVTNTYLFFRLRVE